MADPPDGLPPVPPPAPPADSAAAPAAGDDVPLPPPQQQQQLEVDYSFSDEDDEDGEWDDLPEEVDDEFDGDFWDDEELDVDAMEEELDAWAEAVEAEADALSVSSQEPEDEAERSTQLAEATSGRAFHAEPAAHAVASDSFHFQSADALALAELTGGDLLAATFDRSGVAVWRLPGTGSLGSLGPAAAPAAVRLGGFEAPTDRATYTLALSPCGRWVAAGGDAGAIAIYSVDHCAPPRPPLPPGRLRVSGQMWHYTPLQPHHPWHGAALAAAPAGGAAAAAAAAGMAASSDAAAGPSGRQQQRQRQGAAVMLAGFIAAGWETDEAARSSRLPYNEADAMLNGLRFGLVGGRMRLVAAEQSGYVYVFDLPAAEQEPAAAAAAARPSAGSAAAAAAPTPLPAAAAATAAGQPAAPPLQQQQQGAAQAAQPVEPFIQLPSGAIVINPALMSSSEVLHATLNHLRAGNPMLAVQLQQQLQHIEMLKRERAEVAVAEAAAEPVRGPGPGALRSMLCSSLGEPSPHWRLRPLNLLEVEAQTPLGVRLQRQRAEAGKPWLATAAIGPFHFPINCAVPSPDGRFIAVTGDSQEVAVVDQGAGFSWRAASFDIAGSKSFLDPDVQSGAQYAAWNADSTLLAVSSDTLHAVFVFDPTSLARLLRVEGHKRPCLPLCFAPWDKRLLLYGEETKHVWCRRVEERPVDGSANDDLTDAQPTTQLLRLPLVRPASGRGAIVELHTRRRRVTGLAATRHGELLVATKQGAVLRYLATGLAWRPEEHASWPAAFRDAAKQLLLCAAARQPQGHGADAAGLWNLPHSLVLHIVGLLAGRSRADWLPVARPPEPQEAPVRRRQQS